MPTGDQVIKLTPRVMASMATILKELTEAILKILEGYENDSLIKGVTDNLKKNGEVDIQMCKSFAYGDFARKLREHSVPHAVLQDTTTGLILVLTNEQDREKVNALKNELYVEQRRVSRLTADELKRINAGRYMHKVANMSDVEVALFQEQARKYNFVMASEKDKAGRNTLYYAEADAEKAAKAFAGVSMALCGITGRRTGERLQKDLKQMEGITSALQDPSNEFYVVSAVRRPNGEIAGGEYIHFNAEGFTHYRNDEYGQERIVRDEHRGDDRYSTSAYNQVMGIVKPVLLTKQQFDSPDRDQYIKNLSATPAMTREQKRKADIENRARILIAAKLSLDNGNQPENVSDFYNNEVSFSEFFAHEVVNDTHDEEERLRIEKLETAARELDGMSADEQKVAKDYIAAVYSAQSQILSTMERVYNEGVRDLDSKIASMDRRSELELENDDTIR